MRPVLGVTAWIWGGSAGVAGNEESQSLQLARSSRG